ILLTNWTSNNRAAHRRCLLAIDKMANHARSAAIKMVDVENTTLMIKNKTLLANLSGQLPFLG
ncbi:MAG: hypothetical protein K2X63_05250, partial [Burkholderiaceae bacterium]|nr:hypothetical protein [Burkholderiaceae bacterium]